MGSIKLLAVILVLVFCQLAAINLPRGYAGSTTTRDTSRVAASLMTVDNIQNIMSSNASLPRSTPVAPPNGTWTTYQPVTIAGANDRWWIIDYWTNLQGTFSGYSTSFTAVSNTIEGWASGEAILILPINIAYGSSRSNCVWFQFSIQFNSPPYVPVQWNIQNNNCPATSPSDYHLTSIPVSYVVGHSYVASMSPSSTSPPRAKFSITDTTSGSTWSMTYAVPSTSIVYDSSTFSPASAVEGVPYRSSPSYTNVPYFQFTVQHGHTTVSHQTFAMTGFSVPTTINTETAGTATQGMWSWSMIGMLNGLPTVSALTPDKASGTQVVGSTIVWACSASDPEGDPIVYRFWLQTGSGVPWVVTQDWSSSNTWNWIPSAAGTYNVGVWVRDGKHTGPTFYDARLIVNGYSITPGPTNGPPVISGLSPDKASPQVVGTTVTWTSSAGDPEGDPISYRFWLQAGSSAWMITQDWSSSSTWAWTPTVAGTYNVGVWVRDGKHADPTGFDVRLIVNGYSITSAPPNSPPTITSFSSDKPSPQTVATSIVWTCSGSDAESDPLSYRFWLQAGSSPWTVTQDWSSTSTWSWIPSNAGAYNVGCWVRDGKHAPSTGFDDRKIVNGYSILSAPPNGPPVISGLSPDKASPQVAGTTIVWACSASDPEGDPIVYRFWLQTGSGVPWVVTQDWSSLNTWTWTPSAPGMYNVGCWVRDGKHAGPSGFDDRKIVYGYAIAVASVLIQPPGLTFLTPPFVSGGIDDPNYCRRISSAIWSSGRQ
jgi:hypothetical protein